jgi:bifunctional N-acetylglucosamine-1-phosphate-uridyltransferase/glucosamine-1-phosphate-acetyltransferase GlmU-like protein
MTGYSGNKTLLPLVAQKSRYEGTHPLIREVLENLPQGPKGIVVNHCAKQVRDAVDNPQVHFISQPETNGTGGALLAARSFLQSCPTEHVIITMGDVPLIASTTYIELLDGLKESDLVILGFEPRDRAQYGMIEMEGEKISGIVEWKYWKDYPVERLAGLKYCNAGVYGAKRSLLLTYMDRLEQRPHEVKKQKNNTWTVIKEYFLTDLVAMMTADGLPVGMVCARQEEVMGVDTPDCLEAAQRLYTLKTMGGALIA